MKKLLIVLLILFSLSCNSTDFTKIKKGMKTTEVIKLVGNPNEKKSMFICTWWIYNDSKKHIIIISADTVTNITTKQEFEKGLNDVINFVDSLSNSKIK